MLRVQLCQAESNFNKILKQSEKKSFESQFHLKFKINTNSFESEIEIVFKNIERKNNKKYFSLKAFSFFFSAPLVSDKNFDGGARMQNFSVQL